MKCDAKGVLINGQRLNNMGYADDVILITYNINDLLRELKEKSGPTRNMENKNKEVVEKFIIWGKQQLGIKSGNKLTYNIEWVWRGQQSED